MEKTKKIGRLISAILSMAILCISLFGFGNVVSAYGRYGYVSLPTSIGTTTVVSWGKDMWNSADVGEHTSGTYKYNLAGTAAMCVGADRNGPPVSTQGTVYQLTSANVSGSTELTMPNGSTRTFTNYQVLQAASRAARDSNVDANVYLVIHKLASHIVTGDYYEIIWGSTNTERNVMFQTANYISGSSGYSVYLWIPLTQSGEVATSLQPLISGRPTLDTRENAALDAQFHKQDTSGNPIMNACFVSGNNQQVVNAWGNRGLNTTNLINNLCNNITRLRGLNPSSPEFRTHFGVQCITATSDDAVINWVTQCSNELLGHTGTDYNYVPTREEIGILYAAFSGNIDAWGWYDEAAILANNPSGTIKGLVTWFIKAFYGQALPTYSTAGLGGSILFTDGSGNTARIDNFASCEWTNDSVTSGSSNGTYYYREVMVFGHTLDTNTYNISYTLSPEDNSNSYIVNRGSTALYSASNVANNAVIMLGNTTSGNFDNEVLTPPTSTPTPTATPTPTSTPTPTPPPQITAGVSVTLNKVDTDGNMARGAEFTVYEDASCTRVIGQMSGNNGVYTWSSNNLFASQPQNSSTRQTEVIYVRETSEATQALVNGTWVDRDFRLDDTVYEITYTWIPSTRQMTSRVTGRTQTTSNNARITTSIGNVENSFEVDAEISFSLIKTDEEGNLASGAQFSIYTDEACTVPVQNMDQTLTEGIGNNRGTYSFDIPSSYFGRHYSNEDIVITRTFYIRETSVPTSVYFDGEWIDWNFEGVSDSVYEITVNWEVDTGIITYQVNDGNAITLSSGRDNGTVSIGSVTFATVENIRYDLGLLAITKTLEETNLLEDMSFFFNIYSVDANGNEELFMENIEVTVPFGQTSSQLVIPNVPEGTYRIEEVEDTRFNVDYITSEVTVDIDLATRENLFVFDVVNTPITPELSTLLTNEDSHLANEGEEVTLIDTVSFTNLMPHTEYVVSGYLMLVDEEGNSSILNTNEDGSPITTDVSFITGNATNANRLVDMEVEVEFNVDTTSLNGCSLVAFEELYVADILIAEHKDITDEGQTVHIPSVSTTLTDANSGSHSASFGTITLIDTVSYENLVIGETYRVVGTLMDLSSGEAFTNNGVSYTSEATFVAQQENGTVNVEFTINTEDLDGKTLVAFEELYVGTSLVASHKDLTDEGQTVYIPSISTTLVDGYTNEHIASYGSTTLIDTVSYENLVVGETYRVVGTLRNAVSGEELTTASGEVIRNEVTFTANSNSGTIEVPFTFDSTIFSGDSLVAFEEIYVGTSLVAEHRDLTDEGQTVDVPNISTTLLDDVTNTHTSGLGEEIILVDYVEYENLIVGKTYEMEGMLYYQESGEPLVDENGENIISRVSFAPTTSNGVLEVTFTLDTSILTGETIVAFEDCYYEEVRVAMHHDIEDDGQTIFVPEIQTVATVNGCKTFDISDNITLIDSISYTNLSPNREYMLVGSLMIVNSDGTFAPFTVNGVPVTTTTRFVASETGSGTTQVTFNFDASSLSDNTKLVVFERLYDGEFTDYLVAMHEDITDANQTVTATVPPVTPPQTPPQTPPSTAQDFNIYPFVYGGCFICSASCLALIGFKLTKKKKEEI